MSILDTIRKYYPPNLQAFSKEYDDSKEYNELVERVVYFQKFPEYEKSIFNKINEMLPLGFEVTDITKLQFLDRCFSFHIKRNLPVDPENYPELIFCVSILGPFYCMYEKVIHRIHDNSGNFVGFLNDVNISFNEDGYSPNLVKDLKNVGEALKLQEVTSEVFSERCPGYTIFGISFENFTVFNGLFKDNF